MTRKTGQVAYEFLLMIFFFTITFTVWIILSAEAQEDLRWQQEERVINDLALQLQDDLYFAAQMPEGFTRNLTLPGAIIDQPYTLAFHDGAGGKPYLILRCDDHVAEKDLPDLILPEQDYEAGRLLIITNKGSALEVTSP